MIINKFWRDSKGQIKTNIQSQPKERTEAILVEAVTQLTQLALKSKCPIAVEELDFSEKKKRLRELSSRHNRMLSNFAYSKFLQLLKARCFKLGIEVIEVNPAYSSLIGVRFVLEKLRNEGIPGANRVTFGSSSHLKPLLDDNLIVIWVRDKPQIPSRRCIGESITLRFETSHQRLKQGKKAVTGKPTLESRRARVHE